MPRAFILLLLLATVAAAGLQQDLDELFDRTPVVADAVWTCGIRNLQTGELLYRRNLGRALIPASNQKLFVAAAALHGLGPDFRSATEFFTAGAIEDGTLHGNLIVRGNGAIVFTARYPSDLTATERRDILRGRVEKLAESLRARGIHTVRGGLFPDHSGWQQVVTNEHYPCVGALSFNENTVDVDVRDGVVIYAPEKLVSFAFRYKEWDGSQRRRRAAGRTDNIEINLGRDSQDYWRLEAMAPGTWYCAVLQDMLEDAGIAVLGEPLGLEAVPRPLLTLEGLSLRQLLPDMVVHSDNFRAETLCLVLGHQRYGEAGFKNGGRAVRANLADFGIDLHRFVAADGSGLSRRNRVSAANMLSLLDTMLRSPHREFWLGSLAVSSRSGTLKKHLPSLEGRVRAKTGTLRDVKALSGYLFIDGQPAIVFAMIANDLKTPNTAWPVFEKALGLVTEGIQ
jgi:D-alanyl-D-alanine carboxypeptidase/D-alanyl-D-alanine-endopeptidase (penicillin-binding protein 4)